MLTFHEDGSFEYKYDAAYVQKLAMDSGYRLDNNGAAFLAREMENILPRSYDVLKAPLSAQRLFPSAQLSPAAAEVSTYKIFKDYGKGAAIITDYSDDMPKVETALDTKSYNIREIASAYSISIQEIRAAMANNTTLEQRLANNAVRAIMEKMNNIAFYGDAKHGLTGLFTVAGTDKQAVADGAAGQKTWATKTPEEILKDLNEPITHIITTTNGVERPTSIAMTIDADRIIQTTRMASGTDTTIKEFFLMNNPGISITSAPELKGAFQGNTDGFIVYTNSQDKIALDIPMQPVGYPPQWHNLAYVVNYSMRFGGFVCFYPKSLAFRYGI